MTRTIRFGIFGNDTIEVDDNGFVEIPVIIQESGLFAGTPPQELMIHQIGIHGEDEFNKQYTAKLNRNTDLPFYLATAKIKIVGTPAKHTDESLKQEGIKPLED